MLRDFFSVVNHQTNTFQCPQPGNLDLVDRKLAVGSRMPANQIVNHAGKVICLLFGSRPGCEIEHRSAGDDLADEWIEAGQIGEAAVLEQHHVAVGKQQARAKRIMCVPQLHVRSIGGIPNVQRIEHQ
jgi:hypothetical protein